ncbi:MAG: lyase family protein, partial [Candidatus Binataceae bacterium]
MGGPLKLARRPKSRSRTARTRVERDLIGALEIPAAALYGIQTARAVANLSFSGRTLGDYPSMVRGLAMVKCAAARANLDAGVIDAQIARAIEHACRALIAGNYRDHLVADPMGGGGSIGVNQNINEVIANLASGHRADARGANAIVNPKNHVNASQSTADACATAARIAILEQASVLAIALTDCVRAYRAKARELRRVATLARTCLQ